MSTYQPRISASISNAHEAHKSAGHWNRKLLTLKGARAEARPAVGVLPPGVLPLGNEDMANATARYCFADLSNYQVTHFTSGTWSKCSSRVSTGMRCCSASAAIQTSFAGIGRPRFFNAVRNVA